VTSPEENVARVQVGMEAFNRGDADVVLRFFDEDVEIFSSPELANPGTYRGHEGYQQWLANWLEVWDGFEVEVERVEPVGESHVVAAVHQRARGKGSGVEVDMRIAYMFDLAESNTKALHLYPSWDEAVAAAREREAAE
jgi:ketosteroid isomerase-like protein